MRKKGKKTRGMKNRKMKKQVRKKEKKAISFLTTFAVILLLALMNIKPALSVHDSEVTLDPTVVAGAVNNQAFDVEVCVGDESTHAVHEFRVYYEFVLI